MVKRNSLKVIKEFSLVSGSMAGSSEQAQLSTVNMVSHEGASQSLPWGPSWPWCRMMARGTWWSGSCWLCSPRACPASYPVLRLSLTTCCFPIAPAVLLCNSGLTAARSWLPLVPRVRLTSASSVFHRSASVTSSWKLLGRYRLCLLGVFLTVL